MENHKGNQQKQNQRQNKNAEEEEQLNTNIVTIHINQSFYSLK